MKSGRLILFTLVLVAITTACKYFFGPELAWSGFSPVIAIALFAGFIIKQKDMAFLLPLLALFISDAVIHLLYIQNEFDYPGFYTGQWKNYLLLVSIALIGWALKGRSISSLVIGGVAGPTVYFLVSNFLVWKGTSEAIYANSFDGLMTCYAAGLPFYRNALIATLVFLPVILLLYNYMTRHRAVLTVA